MRVALLTRRWVNVRKSAIDRISKCQEKHLCVACLEPLGEEQGIRGTHKRCYHATRRAILAGKFSEEDRIKEGKLLEPKERGRPPSNPVTIEAS